MSYIGQQLPADVFSGFVTDSFTGDGSATTFTLSKAPFSEDALIVVINNVIQKPVTNFTVSGTTLTIVGDAVASGDVIYAMHTSGAVPITLASKVDVNGLSDGVILDADADTTISADTDDQIDFKAGGTDVMSMTATGLTINDGTTITTADNTDTLTLISTDADADSGPNFVLFRNSSSPANDDLNGIIRFDGKDNEGNTTTYAQFISQIIDKGSSGGEDSTFKLQVHNNGAIRNIFTVVGTTGGTPEVVFNDASQNVDFRVESDQSTKAFFVNGEYGHCHITGAGSATKVAYYGSGLGALQIGVGGTLASYDYGVVDGPYLLHNEWFDGSSNKYIADGEAARYGQYNGRHIFYTAGAGSANASCSVSHRFEIANDGTLTATDTSIGSNSDQRLKENIQDFNYDVSKFKLFKPRTFDWKNPEAHTGEATTGFVAQEVESIDSDWAYEIPWDNSKANNAPKEAEEKALCGGEDKKGSKLGKKDAMYISVIQQLITRIEALEDA